jgi:hypothetical protein
MFRSLRFAFLSATILAAPIVFAATPEALVDQTRKNIQVLKGLPEAQLFMLMNSVSQSLGVTCDYCHVRAEKLTAEGSRWAFERDDRPAKATARRMMQMVMALNQNSFAGKTGVTCYSCHRGSTEVARLIPLPPPAWRDPDSVAATPAPPPLPTTKQILDKYASAVGAGAAKATIVQRGWIERSADRNATIEVIARMPDRYVVTVASPTEGTVVQTFAGTTGWVRTPKGVHVYTDKELASGKQRLATYLPVKVTAPPEQLTVVGMQTISGRPAYAVAVADEPGVPKTLSFDVESGLLVRSVRMVPTPLGPLPEQTDFEDYRDLGGTKVPFLIRTSDVAPYDTTTRRFTEGRANPPIDEQMFEMPK